MISADRLRGRYERAYIISLEALGNCTSVRTMMHVGRASRRSYAAFLGYHLGKVLDYERSQDYPWDDMPGNGHGYWRIRMDSLWISIYNVVRSTTTNVVSVLVP